MLRISYYDQMALNNIDLFDYFFFQFHESFYKNLILYFKL